MGNNNFLKFGLAFLTGFILSYLGAGLSLYYGHSALLGSMLSLPLALYMNRTIRAAFDDEAA